MSPPLIIMTIGPPEKSGPSPAKRMPVTGPMRQMPATVMEMNVYGGTGLHVPIGCHEDAAEETGDARGEDVVHVHLNIIAKVALREEDWEEEELDVVHGEEEGDDLFHKIDRDVRLGRRAKDPGDRACETDERHDQERDVEVRLELEERDASRVQHGDELRLQCRRGRCGASSQ